VIEPAASARVDGHHNIIVQAVGSGNSVSVSVDPRVPHLRLTHFEARTKRARGDGADAALLSAYRTDVVRLLGRDNAVRDQQRWLARDRAAISMLDPPEPVELAAIDDLASRRQIFATLLARKRADLTAPELGADAEFDRLLRDEKWSGDPLFLMMAGLVAGTDGVKNALALTHTDLATRIAQRELDRIGRIAAGAGIDSNNRRLPGLVARHMAVLATLCQGLTLADARTLIEEESQRLGSPADINTTLAALRDGLPGAGDGPEIAPILPDIVGEAAIIFWLGSGGVLSGLGIDPLASIHRAATTALGRTSQVLVRTAQDFAAAGRDEPVRWLYAIAQATEADLDALIVIANALPHQTMALRELAVELTQSVADRLRSVVIGGDAADGARSALSASLSNLGVRLGALGRREEALAASQEAVDIYRRLAQTRPDAFLPDLASSLNNLGGDLSNLGRREEALAASQEAVDIYRRLAQTRPEAFLPDLAQSLNNVGVMLSNLGRREDALAATQEAADIRRRLARTRPDAFLPNLATSLNNLGIRLSNLGRREEALAASQEAVDIRRRLAQIRPDAFLPDLATSISVMSDVLAALDRHGEAAQAATRALEILAPFVERYPQTYRGLARTIGDDILRYSEAAGQPPGNALLARVARALGEGEAVEEESATEAMKSKIDAILNAAEKGGALDEDALAELPSGLAEQLRAAWTATRSGSGTENPGG
jgi:tetratricopeptide (TPR) repeat protein